MILKSTSKTYSDTTKPQKKGLANKNILNTGFERRRYGMEGQQNHAGSILFG